MNAAEFFEHFEAGFSAQALPLDLKKMAGKRPKWKIQTSVGALEFKLATDFKGAGLLGQLLWPGEFRMHVNWITGRGKERKESRVSLFQYTTEAEVESFTRILRNALKKYLAAGGPDPYGTLRDYLTDETALPRPNVDTFYFYFDAHDATTWGTWYGSVIGPWISRFVDAPESNEDWAWRVLWPHLERPKPVGG